MHPSCVAKFLSQQLLLAGVHRPPGRYEEFISLARPLNFNQVVTEDA